jgi:hypothetical protein
MSPIPQSVTLPPILTEQLFSSLPSSYKKKMYIVFNSVKLHVFDLEVTAIELKETMDEGKGKVAPLLK